jgi:Uma2 family endonuclease
MATLAQTDFAKEMTLTGIPLPITLRPPVPLTDDEIMIFSRRNRPYQIERNVSGELEIMSPAGGEGSAWEALVILELGLWARDHGGVSFSSNCGFNLPDGSMRSPDAAWVSDERWFALTKVERRGYPPICPDFVLEVLSPSDSRKTLEMKMQAWIDNGAKLAWMIDPYKKTLSIYRPGSSAEVLERPESVEAREPVAGFRLSTLLLWDE